MNELWQILESNEKIIWEGKPKYFPFMFSVFLGALILFGILSIISYTNKNSLYLLLGIVLAVGSLILGYLRYQRTHYAITNKRLVYQSGIIGRDFKSVDYDKIQNASVNVGVLGVLFKCGDVQAFSGEMTTVSTRNGSSTRPVHDTFRLVADPYFVLKRVQERLSHRKETLYSGKPMIN